MKMNALDRMRIKDNHKIREIEDYLDSEIENILNKKRFARDYNDYSDRETGGRTHLSAKVKSLFRDRPSADQEQYLPFEKEQLRPVVSPRRRVENPEEEVGGLILDTLQPIIEGWLDDNLERVVHKVVKRKILQQEEKIRKVADGAKRYYNDEYEQQQLQHQRYIEDQSYYNQYNDDRHMHQQDLYQEVQPQREDRYRDNRYGERNRNNYDRSTSPNRRARR